MKRMKMLVLLGFVLGSLGSAAYVYEDDIYIGLCTDEAMAAYVDTLISIEGLGKAMFELQEGVHDGVTDTTGQEVDHYYVWIGFCGRYVPVDPFRFSN